MGGNNKQNLQPKILRIKDNIVEQVSNINHKRDPRKEYKPEKYT